jgi:hypothetical protein
MDCASPMRSLIVALIFPTRRRWTVRFGRAEVRTKETADPTARRGRLSTSLCRKTLPGRVRGTADPSTACRDRSASLGGCDFFLFRCSLRSESSQKHLPTSIAGVPSATLGTGSSTPRHKASVCDRSAKRFAPTASRGRQDDGFVGGLECSWLGMLKHEKIEKVTGSRDDKGERCVSI